MRGTIILTGTDGRTEAKLIQSISESYEFDLR